MSASLLYATRSFLPSASANAVQSAHMAATLARAVPGTVAIYRTPTKSAESRGHFSPFGVEPPPACIAVRCYPRFEHSHVYVLRFLSIFRRFGSLKPLVYTRSARLSWAAACAGLPLVLELHDPLIPLRRRWLRHLHRTGRLPAVVATTHRLRDDLISEVDLPPDRILVAGGAACPKLAAVRPSEKADGGGFHVGYAGSALQGKGVEQVIACARILTDYTFHLIGPSLKECQRLCPIPANLRFHGYCSAPEVMARIKSMDALLLPNQRSVIIRSGADIGQHTSPLKLFEYLASGCPIVASDLPVFQNILKDGENALLAPPEDTPAFCAALRALQTQPALARRLGEVARKDFLENHTWSHRVDRILRFIRSLHLPLPDSPSSSVRAHRDHAVTSGRPR
ncbi:MAG: glycosyltransferase family 4 protein [Opitutales bacterium]|nr:glycosyltransferase family 4 protein [Opitutales bacterium]